MSKILILSDLNQSGMYVVQAELLDQSPTMNAILYNALKNAMVKPKWRIVLVKEDSNDNLPE